VRHPHPHIKPGIDACGNCTLGIAERVVQQHFVITDMNADGWHPGKLTVKWRSQWMFRVGASQIGMHEFGDPRASEQGIGIRARLIRRARKGEVGNRIKHGNPNKGRIGGDGFAGNARGEPECEIAAGGIARERNPANAAPGKSPIARKRWEFGRPSTSST
jgi:hypothetical protein